MTKFELLKRTYPVSEFDRLCDGYDYIMVHSSKHSNLQRIIKKGEKFIYQVGKENGVFQVKCISFSNYRIIREELFDFNED
jgi:hypothetical protein